MVMSMKYAKAQTLLNAFRHDRLRGVWLALFVLFVPYLPSDCRGDGRGQAVCCRNLFRISARLTVILFRQWPTIARCASAVLLRQVVGADPTTNPAHLEPVFLALAPADFSVPSHPG